jgi:hypothetical protein
MATTFASPESSFFAPGQFNITRRTIVSIFPMELEATLRHGPVGTNKAFTRYVMPAAPKDGYTTLVVEDGQEWIMNWEIRELRPAPHSATSIANSLVHLWTSGTLGADSGFKPGIMLCAGDTPTEEELAHLREQQTRFFRALIDDGHAMFNRQEFKNISDLHRAAARWMGVRVPWLVQLEQAQEKKCAACGENILTTALVCKHCNTNLVNFFREMNLPVERDPFIADFIASLKANNGAQSIGSIRTPEASTSERVAVKPPAPTIRPPLQNIRPPLSPTAPKPAQ